MAVSTGSASTGTGVGISDDQLVGFGPRLVAAIIDGILIGIVAAILSIVKLSALAGLVALVYFLFFWSTSGQTVGARVMKFRVAKIDGSDLSWGTGIIRVIGFVISEIPIYLGLLWVLWDPKKQGWHDKMAGTVVVRS